MTPTTQQLKLGGLTERPRRRRYDKL